MREQISNVIYGQKTKGRSTVYYDWFIMVVAIASVVPMMFRGALSQWMQILESITVYILFFDYILRWITHDFRMKNHSIWAFFIYPFTPLAIMDIAGILPTLGLLPPTFMILRVLRLVKLAQYSQSCRRVMNVFRSQAKTLCSVLIIAMPAGIVTAGFMFVRTYAAQGRKGLMEKAAARSRYLRGRGVVFVGGYRDVAHWRAKQRLGTCIFQHGAVARRSRVLFGGVRRGCA